jgi:acetoin utilization deacetylase AcuC-like enzyme
MMSAGFDSRANNPLGRFTLSDRDFSAHRDPAGDWGETRGRAVSVLEGGYLLDGLPQAVGAHLARLSADD